MPMNAQLTAAAALVILLCHQKRKRKRLQRERYQQRTQTYIKKFLTMPLAEKRKIYLTKTYVELKDVDSWGKYFNDNESRLKQLLAKEQYDKELLLQPFPVNESLNKLVSIWKGDITQLEIDCIVNAANSSLLGGGGVDGAIHRAAGPLLKAECAALKGCKTGDAKITGGYKLPSKHVIHTVGPQGEKPDLLTSCYRTSLDLMLQNNLRSVAFPCISTGIYGFPQLPAANVAISTVREFLENNSSKVERIIFTLFLEQDVKIYESLMQLYFPLK